MRINIGGIDIVLGENTGGIVLMLARDHIADLLRTVVVIGDGHTRGCDQIHTIGHAIDVFVDPVELNFQCLGVVARRAQDTQPASLADFYHDVTAVGKGDQWEFDIQ